MTTPAETLEGRLSNGQFAAGNRGGPGNPYSRQTAMMRHALLSCITKDDMIAIVDALIEKAKEGNVQAIKMVLYYTLGKPGAMDLSLGLNGFGEYQPSGNGVNGEHEGQTAKEPPSGNGVNGQKDAEAAMEAPLVNGVNGPKTNLPGFSAPPGGKMSKRALRKMRKADRMAKLYPSAR